MWFSSYPPGTIHSGIVTPASFQILSSSWTIHQFDGVYSYFWKHCTVLYRLAIIEQWNFDCRTTLISNKSVPEHKPKTKIAPVSEQNFGSRTGQLATIFHLRHQLSSVRIKPSYIFVYILSIDSVYSFCLRFYAFSLFCIRFYAWSTAIKV
jgi:hypothetical protein